MGKPTQRPRHRALKQEFLDVLAARGAVPKHATLKAWLESRGCGARTQSLIDLLKGASVEERLISAAVEMFLRDIGPGGKGPMRRALDEFLGDARANFATRTDVEAVAACVCTAPTPAAPSDERRFSWRDFFGVGIARLGGLAVEPLMRRCVRACRTDDEAREAAEWICLLVGRTFAGESCSRLLALETAHRRMGVAPEAYAERVLAWRRATPWAVLRAVRGDVAVGATILLPVSESAYDDVAEGRRPSWDLSGDELLPASRRLIVEAVAERPASDVKVRRNPTLSLLGCHAVQHVALMRIGDWGGTEEVRVLSFGGTPLGRKRLADVGYRPTGVDMAVAGVDLWERRCGTDGEGWSHAEYGFLMKGIRSLPADPPGS